MAEGTYPGFVEFGRAGIERIGKLTITKPDREGNAAGFFGCRNLKVAEGTFPGYVDFSNSNIKKIGKLEITVPIKGREKANFTGCHDLRLPEKFLRPEYLMDAGIRQKALERIAAEKAIKASPAIEI